MLGLGFTGVCTSDSKVSCFLMLMVSVTFMVALPLQTELPLVESGVRVEELLASVTCFCMLTVVEASRTGMDGRSWEASRKDSSSSLPDSMAVMYQQ